MLRGVRALRLVFGWNVEAEAADHGGYAELLRGGFAALDDMWRADDRFADVGRFTMDMFHRVVAARPEGGADPDAAAYRALLSAARAQPQGTSLRDFAPGLPAAVDRAVAWTRQPGVHPRAEAADVLRRTEDQVGPAALSRLFWARVEAEETLERLGAQDVDALIPKVLGTDPSVAPDETLRANMRGAFTATYAAGWNGSDPDVVAAYRLTRLGAHGTDTELRTANTAETLDMLTKESEDNRRAGRRVEDFSSDLYDGLGRDFGPEPKPARVDLSQIHTPNGLRDTKWISPQDNVTTSPKPVLVRAVTDPGRPGIFRVRLDNVDHEVSLGVFLELLATDRELMKAEADAPIVLALTGLDADAARTARRFADRLARTVWWTREPVDLSETGDNGLPVLTVRPGPLGSSVLPDGGWRRTLPRRRGPQGAPSSVCRARRRRPLPRPRGLPRPLRRPRRPCVVGPGTRRGARGPGRGDRGRAVRAGRLRPGIGSGGGVRGRVRALGRRLFRRLGGGHPRDLGGRFLRRPGRGVPGRRPPAGGTTAGRRRSADVGHGS